jgi:hypothetical protein
MKPVTVTGGVVFTYYLFRVLVNCVVNMLLMARGLETKILVEVLTMRKFCSELGTMHVLCADK